MDQSFKLLNQNSRSIGFSIYERLLLLENEIKLIAHYLSNHISDEHIKQDLELNKLKLQGFNDLKLIDRASFSIQRLNYINNFSGPKLNRNLKFDSEQTIILTQPYADAKQSMFMVVELKKDELKNNLLIGEINSEFLWELGDKQKLPFMTELCVLNSAGELLFTSISEPYDLLKKISYNRSKSDWTQFIWDHKGHKYLAKYRELFLNARFSEKEWIIVLSQSKADALSAVKEFRIFFPLVLLLSLFIMLYFSNSYIKKRLKPLKELKKGTQRIADGDFTSNVIIQSGDEFEDLSYSFNKMSKKLHYLFNRLNMIAEIGQTASTFSNIRHYVERIIKTFIDYLNFDCGMILVADKEKNNLYYAGGLGYSRQEINNIEKQYVDIKATNSSDPVYSAFANKEEFSGYKRAVPQLNKLAAQNESINSNKQNFSICVPIIYKNESIGILVLESLHFEKLRIEGNEISFAGITSQLAVSMSNIFSYNKLIESEKRFRKVFDHAASGIALINLNGNFIKVNNIMTQMIGMTNEELRGKNLQEISHPDDIDLALNSQNKILKGDIDFDTYEQRFLNSDGHVCWSLVSTSLLRNNKGTPSYFISLFKDLTDKKRNEKEKRRLESRLQQAQKLEAIGTLAGGIAHDFNNILSGIMGYTQLGMMDITKDSKTYPRFEGILEACDRATDLVKQILTFSRQHKHEKAPIQVSVVIKEALKLLRATLPPNIKIIENISNEPGIVLADATQIHQVVMNLCTNAYHAMVDKGGTLAVNLTHEKIMSSALDNKSDNKPQSYLKMTVSDTGFGIDKSIINKIFDPYYTTKESNKGTGLGLSVVHGIIESHGGKITVQSERGKGAIFEVLLPKDFSATISENRSSEIPLTGNERILFVDDDETITEIGKSILERLGYQVLAFTNPKRALYEFSAHKRNFDLVITDMLMPHLTGEELAKKIREIRPEIPILLCTGYNEKITSENKCSKTINEVFMKPLEINKLSKIIRKMLDKDINSVS